ncbi:MAG: CrcB family protein [Candidatus Bipolaricaulota bacterium]
MGQKLLLLGIAGALGTLSRYALGGIVQRIAGGSFPWGTLAVNGLGCLLFGLFWACATERFAVGHEVRTVILVGFLGAFTTFSSFVAEFGQMALGAEWLRGAAYVLAQNVLGFASFFVGMAVGRAL